MTSANPYAAPTTNPSAVVNPGRRIYGGLRRGKYALYLLGMMVIAFIPFLGLITLILSPIAAWHRMKNVGYHPALGLLILVPIANLWAALICLAAQTGYRDSRKLDTTGKVILGIFIGLIVLVIAAAIIIPNLLAHR